MNHYIGYRAILKNGRPLAVQYKTSDTNAFQKEFSNILSDAIHSQGWKPPEDDERHFYVDAVFYFPRARMDSNNYWKVLLDTITDTKLIWKDDDVVCERTQAIYYDADNPRIVLDIYPVDYIGVFEDSSHFDEFVSRCIGCNRYTRNCKILKQAKFGRIQEEVVDGVCTKWKGKKNEP